MAGIRSRWLHLLGRALIAAPLIVALVAPAPQAAAARTRFTQVHLGDARTTGRVDVLTASRPARPASRDASTGAPPATSEATASGPVGATAAAGPLPPLTVARTVIAQGHADVMLEPPDPWVAANDAFVISSSNGLVRVMNRAGSVLADIPTVTLFATDGGHFESDPRILWDPAHARWLGVVVTYDNASADTSLTLVVSDTMSPLGSWTVHRLGYGRSMPDFPGIASTADEVVLTANLLEDGETYTGSSVQVVDWASLLAGGTTASDPLVCTTCWNLRPARASGVPPATGYLLYEDPISLDPGNHDQVWLTSVAGTAKTVSRGPDVDLGIAAGPDTFPRGPRQPGGTIQDPSSTDTPIDSRFPDVVVNGDTMFFARTMLVSQGGSAPDFVVEAYTLSIAGALAGAPAVTHKTVGTPDVDIWMPGVGISTGDATAGTGFFLTYMRSSAAEAPSALAAASLDGVDFTDPKVVAASAAPYTGTFQRWGDFMGITPDPAGTMAVWSATEVSGADGGWQQVVDRLVLDGTPPASPAGIPTERLVAGTQLGVGTVPVQVAFAPTSDPQSGIRNYAVTDGATGASVTVAGTSLVVSVAASAAGTAEPVPDSYSAVAVNDAGLQAGASDQSPPLAATVFGPTRPQTVFSTGWTVRRGAVPSAGAARSSSTPGAWATFHTTGASFAWVSDRAASRGRAKVYVDGVLKATVSLRGSVTKPRYIPYAIAFGSPDAHTIKVVVVSGRVDVDAFVVLR